MTEPEPRDSDPDTEPAPVQGAATIALAVVPSPGHDDPGHPEHAGALDPGAGWVAARRFGQAVVLLVQLEVVGEPGRLLAVAGYRQGPDGDRRSTCASFLAVRAAADLNDWNRAGHWRCRFS